MLEKVLILGSTGLIGHQIFNYFKKDESYELINIAYRKKLEDFKGGLGITLDDVGAGVLTNILIQFMIY